MVAPPVGYAEGATGLEAVEKPLIPAAFQARTRKR
jgi:hypothetical protein